MFCLSVCNYEKSMHEVRRLIPKMREIFTNRLRIVSGSIISRAKRCLVKYHIHHASLSCKLSRAVKFKSFILKTRFLQTVGFPISFYKRDYLSFFSLNISEAENCLLPENPS